MLKIELHQTDGSTKTYTQTFVSARMFREAITMQKLFQEEITETTVDKLVSFVVDVFGKQFTVDEFYDGVESSELMNEVIKAINSVTNKLPASEGGNDDPN